MVKTQWGYLLEKRNKSVGLLLRRAVYPRYRHVVILYLRHNDTSIEETQISRAVGEKGHLPMFLLRKTIPEA